MLFVDASENGVGIGDGTVLGNGLRIQSATGSTNSIDTKLYLSARSSGTTTTGFGPGITFAGDRNGDSNIQQMAKINAIAEVNSGTTLSSGLSFQTATAGSNSEKMRINNLGNVGLSVVPDTFSSGYTALQINGYAYNIGHSGGDHYITNNAYFNSGWKYGQTSTAQMIELSSGQIQFKTVNSGSADSAITWVRSMNVLDGGGVVVNDDSADMDFRVESNGNANMIRVDGGNNVVNIGHATNTVGTSSGTLLVNFTGNVANGIKIRDTRGEAGTNNMMVFVRGDSEVGSITATTSATAYNTSSDQRLKENIADADDSGELIDAIQVRKFDWKADGSHQDYGMVAQELQTVAPEAVSAPENPDEMMAVDYSKLVPMLVKEIQTLRARVADLES
jgi:hypothetical protein